MGMISTRGNTTTTTGTPFSFQGSANPDASALASMFARRLAQREQDRERAIAAEDDVAQQRTAAPRAPAFDETAFQTMALRRGPSLGTPAEQQLQNKITALELRDAEARHAAATNLPPMRMVSGPNIIGGWTMDPTKMNAYQRQAYLPQTAGYGGAEPNRAQLPATVTGGRAIESDDGSYATGPGVVSGNPYATGAGYVRGRYVGRG